MRNKVWDKGNYTGKIETGKVILLTKRKTILIIPLVLLRKTLTSAACGGHLDQGRNRLWSEQKKFIDPD